MPGKGRIGAGMYSVRIIGIVTWEWLTFMSRLREPQARQQVLHVIRQGTFKAQRGSADGMIESQKRGMKCLPWKGFDRIRHLSKRLDRGFACAAINRITDQTQSGMSQMNADLMGATRFQLAFDQHRPRRLSETLQHSRPCHGMAATVEVNRLPLSVRGVTRQTRGDLEDTARLKADTCGSAQPWIGGIDDSMRKRKISTLCRMGLELGCQSVMRAVGFGDDQQAGCVLVNPVNNPRPAFAADTGQAVGAMSQQRVHQRSRRRARRGMHNHSRRFVDHKQIRVLMDNIQRDIFRPCLDGFGIGQDNAVFLSLGHPGLAVPRHAFGTTDRAICDQPCKARARKRGFRWHCERKGLIKPFRRIGRDGDNKVRHDQG